MVTSPYGPKLSLGNSSLSVSLSLWFTFTFSRTDWGVSAAHQNAKSHEICQSSDHLGYLWAAICLQHWFNRPTFEFSYFRRLYDTLTVHSFTRSFGSFSHFVSFLSAFLFCLLSSTQMVSNFALNLIFTMSLSCCLPFTTLFFVFFFSFCRFLLPANFLSSFSHSFLPQKWVLCVHRSLVSYDRVLSVWLTWANCSVTMLKDLVI